MSWDAPSGAGPGGDWNSGGGGADANWGAGSGGGGAEVKDEYATSNADGGDANGYDDHAGGGGGSGGGCFNCGEEGHMKNECPNPRKGGGGSGACFNCGEEGHMKSECTNPKVVRPFDGICSLCEEQGHRKADCPTAPPRLCKNCNEEGHSINDCKNARAIDRSGIEDVLPEVAFEQLKAACLAVVDKDLDEVKEAADKYVKGNPDITYLDLEMIFRMPDFGDKVFLIALENPNLLSTYTLMDLQGNLDKKYQVRFSTSKTPPRPKEKQGWPKEKQNLERLKDCGVAVDRRLPKCTNCDELGHTKARCPEEKRESERVQVKCYLCEQIGHRMRDCKQPRVDKFACRNCGKSGHGSRECPEPRDATNVECKRCNEMGHFSKDCPTGGGFGCRNCGQEGHKAAECTEPKDMSKVQCRNCDEFGHGSRECPKPRDYSRVECQNCHQMGHTKVRCKQPIPSEEAPETGAGDDYGATAGNDYSAGGDDGGFVAQSSGDGEGW